MKTLYTDVSGQLNIGLYGFVTDSFAILAPIIKPKLATRLKNLFDVPVCRTSIGDTNLVGAFIVGHDNHIVVPSIITKDEQAALREAKIPFTISHDTINALGNCCVTDQENTVVNPELSEETKKLIGDALGTKVHDGKIGGLVIVGSLSAINKKNLLLPNIIHEDELQLFKSIFKKNIIEGNLMNGPYLRPAILANRNGAAVSKGVAGADALVLADFLDI